MRPFSYSALRRWGWVLFGFPLLVLRVSATPDTIERVRDEAIALGQSTWTPHRGGAHSFKSEKLNSVWMPPKTQDTSPLPVPYPLQSVSSRNASTPLPNPRLADSSRIPATSVSGGRIQLAALDPSPIPTTSFAAGEDDGTSATPDTSGAIGPHHVVTVLNTLVRIQDREGTTRMSASLDQFFSNFGSDIFTYDPRCLYEPYSGHWIITAGANPTLSTAGVVLAVSVGEDPEGDWYRYYIPLDPDQGRLYADSPVAGFNAKWIAIQVNGYDSVTGNFVESQILAFDKQDVGNGGPGAFSRFHLAAADYGASQIPAVTMDPAFNRLLFVKSWVGNYVDPGTKKAQGLLRIFSLSGDIGQESLNAVAFVTTASEGSATPFTWADFRSDGADLGNQSGNTNRIQLGDSRIHNVVYRGSSLWCSQSVLLPASKPVRSGVQWWEIFEDGRLFQRHLVEDSTAQWSFSYPSLAVNNHFDVLLGYNAFSSAVYPSAYYRMYPNDTVLNAPQSEQLVHFGQGPYVDIYQGQNRWGDWSASCVDPLNDGALWTLQEYSLPPSTSDSGRWGVWWVEVTPAYDLVLAMRASTNRVVVGQPLQWSLILSNRIVSFAYTVSVTNPIPEGFVADTVSSTAGTVEMTEGNIRWSLPVVGVTSIVCQVSGRVTGWTPGITNRALASAYGLETNLTNNQASLLVPLFNGAPVVLPSLEILAETDPIQLRWPVGYLGFVVEQRSSLSGSTWVAVSAPISQEGPYQVVTLPNPGGTTYYRLRRVGL